MHPETKKLTQKNTPYLTLTEKLKLQSPGFVASCDIQPGNGVALFWDKHVYLLTYLPRTHTGHLGHSCKQVGQLSQINRAAACVSFGKCEKCASNIAVSHGAQKTF